MCSFIVMPPLFLFSTSNAHYLVFLVPSTNLIFPRKRRPPSSRSSSPPRCLAALLLLSSNTSRQPTLGKHIKEQMRSFLIKQCYLLSSIIALAALLVHNVLTSKHARVLGIRTLSKCSELHHPLLQLSSTKGVCSTTAAAHHAGNPPPPASSRRSPLPPA